VVKGAVVTTEFDMATLGSCSISGGDEITQ